MTMFLSYTHILLVEPKIREVLDFEDHFSVPKHKIKHPVVYVLSSVLTLKIFNDINATRHNITRIIGT